MNTLLVDPPPASTSGEPPVADPPQDLRPTDAPESPAPGPHCANCGAPMDPAQNWCLQCGAGAPGSLGGLPGWRSAAGVAGVVLVLMLGAGAAAYAALNKSSSKPATKAAGVALAQTSTPTSPSTPPPTESSGSTSSEAGGQPSKTSGTEKPPALPFVSSTPEESGAEPEPVPGAEAENESSGSEGESSGEESTGSEGKSGGSGKEAEQTTPIVLDTNAASTYNPYNYPATEFGDPHLAIDGDATTAWTAQVNPAVAPKMAEGLLINLKGSKSIEKISMVSATPGMTVQVFGTNAKKVPTSITDKGWVKLSNSHVAKDRKATIKLYHASKSFRYVVLWIPKAPESLVSTPEAPGSVEVNELVLSSLKQ